MTTRWARFARGWLAAVFSTLVAAVSHTLAGGTGPSAVSIVIALAFAGIACIALTGKKLSLPRLSAAVVVSQLAFHTVFSTIGAAGGVATVSSGGVHSHATSILLGGVATGESGMRHQDGWMWLGHTVAALVTIVALRYGEAAFWRLREIALLCVRVLFAPLPVTRVARPRARAIVAWQLRTPRAPKYLRLCLGLRGPPVASFT